MSKATVVSAPGKVLIAGGYLVLDREYEGLVIGVDARFYTIIKQGTYDSFGKVVVRSPQFLNASWEYAYIYASSELESNDSDNKNPFVEIAIKYSLAIISRRVSTEKFKEKLRNGLDIYIVGDNDFYSQREQLNKLNLPLTASSLRSLDSFCKLNTTLKEVHKTGLGSSASMITSLVAALFINFEAIDIAAENEENAYGRTLIHNVAQFCHSLAQGKVGSGFDVSSAVWGSHVYRRFLPGILSSIMSNTSNFEHIYKIVSPENKWDNLVTPFSLPPEFILVLADVDAGSHTPSMVGKVLAWRKNNLDRANSLWTKLGTYNNSIVENMHKLSEIYAHDPSTYTVGINLGSLSKGSELPRLAERNSENKVIQLLSGIYVSFQTIRELLREMSTQSDVPIEPPMQTRLLDACMEVPGVLMAGVPGAGGFDAIFCITISQAAIDGIERVWNTWEEMSVAPLLTRASSKGFIKENLDDHARLKAFLR
ncbi:9509_t:CDS:2 [Ambispora gerdemannii]|uniref:Phosphomevalonate kinase n=1 Tax=Ambispora gerdemannii TaxID=144530 RepID=A0A9N9BGF0_9GLOM|nr:9509_t:CDS:2 [Ambispora gerdemannii]